MSLKNLKERWNDGSNPFFKPLYNQYSKNIYTNYIAPCLYLLTWIMIFIGILAIIISPVEAAQTVNSSINLTDIKDTSLTWSIEYLTDNRPIGATLDNVEIDGFNTQFNSNYTATKLEPNTTHTFCVYGSATINCLEGTTSLTLSSKEKLLNFIYDYLFLIVALILMVIGIVVPISSLIGFIFAVLGLISVFPKGNLVIDLIYLAAIAGALGVTGYGMRN